MGIFSDTFFLGSKAASSIGKVSSDWIPASIMRGITGGGYSRAGSQVSEQSALFSSAVFACQRAISESLAVLPRNIYKELDGGGREVQKKHPSAKVLKGRPNPIMSSLRFFELLQRQSIAAGNGYAEIQLNKAGDVIALWPLPPDKVEPRPVTRGGELDIVYDIRINEEKKITLSKDRVLHIPGVGFDGVKGYPLIDYMLHAVGLDQALTDYSSRFFKQGGGLPGYVTVPDTFNEDQLRNLKTHYEILNDGLDNAWRLKFLYESSKFTPQGATPVDSQMQESKIFQIQEIARFHRMPLHKIQETSKGAGYNSLEQFNIEFVNDTLMPHIMNWEEELDRKLFEEGEGYYVKFNTNALLRGDSKSRSEYYRTMVFTSLMVPNEARALEDLPPIEGGNERMFPLNMTNDSKVAGESNRSMNSNDRVQD